jgi:ketosteroid isomerase-like protein
VAANGDIVRQLFGLIDSGQIDRRAELLTPQTIQRRPQSGEVMRGRDRLLEATRRRPSKPRVRLAHLVEADDEVSVACSADYGDGKVWRNASFFRLRDGRIIEETDYFGEPFEGPAWRADRVDIEHLPTPTDPLD